MPHIYDGPARIKKDNEEELKAMEAWRQFVRIVGDEMGLAWKIGVHDINPFFPDRKIGGRWHKKGFMGWFDTFAEFGSIERSVHTHLCMMEILDSGIHIYISEKYRGCLPEFAKAVAKAEAVTGKTAFINICPH